MERPGIAIAAFLALAASLLPGPARAQTTLTGPNGMDWDVYETTTGYLNDGETDVWDGAYYLSVNSIQYTAGGVPATPILAGRGLRMAQQYPTSSLTVQRTIWVPATGTHDYLRYFDTFGNGSSSPIPVTATYTGNLGSDSSTIVVATSSGDTLVSAADAWYSTHDSSSYDTPTGCAWWDGTALGPNTESLSSDSFTTTFQFDVPALSTVALMIFVVQETTRAAAQATLEWLADLPEEAMEGLTGEEMMQVLNWQAGGAPVIRLLTDPLEVDEGGDLLLELDVQDLEGDTFTVAWDLDGDGSFDDGTGLTATWSAAGLDGPASGAVAVRATDSGGESRDMRMTIVVRNAVPVFSTDPAVDPGLIAHRGQTWEYRIAVDDPANVGGIIRDPVTVTVPVKPTGMIFFGDLRLRWAIPDSVDVIGDHQVRIEADDHEDGLGVQDFLITIPENTPPPAPVVVSPDHSVVSTVRPTLIIENVVDIEGDPIIYTFQVDSTGEFSTSTLVAVGQRNAAAGAQTTWVVNVDLADGNRYYWRVWANDGTEDSPATLTYFDVDLSAAEPDPEPDASSDDPVDASTDTGWDISPPGDEGGCSCTMAGSGGVAGGRNAGLILAALMAVAGAALGLAGSGRGGRRASRGREEDRT